MSDLSFVLVAELALDPFPPFFAESGLDPVSSPCNVSALKATSVFADAGRNSSSSFFADVGLDPIP